MLSLKNQKVILILDKQGIFINQIKQLYPKINMCFKNKLNEIFETINKSIQENLPFVHIVQNQVDYLELFDLLKDIKDFN